MAAYNRGTIQQHFKGLRIETGQRKGRNPFATGFEDDSEEETQDQRSRARERTTVTKPAKPKSSSIPVSKPVPNGPVKTSILDQLRDSDDEFLDPPKRTDRRPSPAPEKLASLGVSAGAVSRRRGSVDQRPQPTRTPRAAVALAAGDLAYLDDSEEERDPKSSRRQSSPGPRKELDATDSSSILEQSQTRIQPSRHTVASPFAGTKYLEDTDSDEDAVSSRKGSAASEDSNSNSSPSETSGDPLSPVGATLSPKHPEVNRVDKPKKTQSGGGVSWRAFSASRTEQRNTELEALQASLRQRGKSIAFGTHAVTDDGKRVPIPVVADLRAGKAGTGKTKARSKSPPKRDEDTKPTQDEVGDGAGDTQQSTVFGDPFEASPTSGSMASHTLDDDELRSPQLSPTTTSAMTDSAESIMSKLTVSPQTIQEGQMAEHTITSPTNDAITSPISRESSMRSARRRIPPTRRTSRRSTSANASASPAQQFLNSWQGLGDVASSTPEPQPDDEGQEFGLDDEKYVLGAKINQGGFGVIKKAHSITDRGATINLAVKIVRKTIPEKSAAENEKAQEEIEHEVSVWRHLNHRHILRLRAVFATDFATFCLMDLNDGGTLHDAVRRARKNSITVNGGRRGIEAKLAKNYAFQLACALRYLHQDVRVCHRDVKLENCLIDMSVPHADTEGGLLRLCDFGLADFLDSDASSAALDDLDRTGDPAPASVIGTLQYASPRGLSVDRKLFETPGDVWALGVIIYALCTGDLPFNSGMQGKIIHQIMHEAWPENALREAAEGGDAVLELVKGCLEKDVGRRWGIGEVLGGEWFEGCVEVGEGEGGF